MDNFNEEHIDCIQYLIDLYNDSEVMEFNILNIWHIRHIMVSLVGYDGLEVKNLIYDLYIDFLDWYKKNKNDCYIPFNGSENMLSIQFLEIFLEISNRLDTEKKYTIQEIIMIFNMIGM